MYFIQYSIYYGLKVGYFLLKMRHHAADCCVSLSEANWRKSHWLSKYYSYWIERGNSHQS